MYWMFIFILFISSIYCYYILSDLFNFNFTSRDIVALIAIRDIHNLQWNSYWQKVFLDI